VLAGVIPVTEEDLEKAIAFIHEKHHQVIEGAGATGVAALLSGKVDTKGKKVGVFISGGNIDDKKLVKVLNKYSS
jgi:threonine dehydratase